jgi:hypothetical protein
MNGETDHARPLPDDTRRRLIGALAVVTLAIAMLGPNGLRRLATRNGPIDGNDVDREHIPGELDGVSSRALYEVVYYDRRLKSFWPVGFYPEISSVVAAGALADETQWSDCDD